LTVSQSKARRRSEAQDSEMTTSMLIYLCKFFIKAAAGIGAASLFRLGIKKVITDYREVSERISCR
jgi:hypothetical protein